MSLNLKQLSVNKIMDPRLELSEHRAYNVLKGSLVNSWQQFNATNVNNSSVQITANPPNRDIAISRFILKRVTFSWQVTGTNTSGGTLLNSGFFGPRFMPLTSVTLSEQVTINNDTLTQAPIRQYWRALLRYRNDFADRWGVSSLAPSMMDQFQNYSDGVGTVRNPLGEYGDNSFENTRKGFVGFTIDPQAPGNTTATGTLTTTEPILISPFCYGANANYYSAIVGVQNMSYNATFGNLSRILSLVQGQGVGPAIVLNEPTVTIDSASLLFNYLTPDPIMPIPRNIETSYFSLVSYPTRSSVAIAPGATVSLTMQSIQVTSIPRRIYIFARQDDSVETAFTSDSYLSIDQASNPLTLTWNNNQFLSQATGQDLYNISVKNGCNMSYSQFANSTGSVLSLDFGTDIGLMSNQSPGTIGNYQLGLTCIFRNTNPSLSITPTLYVVVVYEGVFSVVDGNCTHMIGVVSPSDVLNAPLLPSGSYKENQDVYGGRFDTIKGLLSKGHDFIKKHKLISKGLSLIQDPYAQQGARFADMLGYGLSGGKLNGNNKVDLSSIADGEESE